jgi:hypothetical protein
MPNWFDYVVVVIVLISVYFGLKGLIISAIKEALRDKEETLEILKEISRKLSYVHEPNPKDPEDKFFAGGIEHTLMGIERILGRIESKLNPK